MLITKLSLKILALILICHVGSVMAWSGRVHAFISIEVANKVSSAYSSQLEAAGNVLAQASPSLYKKWLKQTGYRLDRRDQAIAWLGVWPDTIKNQSLSSLIKKHHNLSKVPTFLHIKKTSRWHYDNVFFYKNTPAHACAQRNNGELFQILSRLDKELQKKPSSELLQAIYLSFYIHFYSDAHQPLHLIARVNKDCWHDKGGNDVCLVRHKKRSSCKVNLHQYWDRAAYQNIHNIPKQPSNTIALGVAHPDNPKFKRALTHEALLIYPFVYPEITANMPSLDKALLPSYQKKAQLITSKQINLAIERLSTRLSMFGLMSAD